MFVFTKTAFKLVSETTVKHIYLKPSVTLPICIGEEPTSNLVTVDVSNDFAIVKFDNLVN